MDAAARAFLEEERAAWRPFEALDQLTDAELDAPIAAAHGWSGRDVIAHVVAWLDDAIEAARELDAGRGGEARERSRAVFAARGDEINAEIQATWSDIPIAEVRTRARSVLRELRALLASLPAARWSDSPDDVRFFHVYTVEHYAEHVADVEAIVMAAGK
jgi:hypothetical protein